MKNGIKNRDAYLCNIKALLIIFVVFGHCIEPYIDNHSLLTMYKLIYSVHMPLFVFVTGLTSKSIKACKKQLVSALKLFAIWDVVYLVYDYFINGNSVNVLRPYWHLWYLLALVFWSFIGMGILWLIEHRINKVVIFIGIFACSLLIGCVNFADRRLAVQRTIAFLPYFYLGMISNISKIKEKRKWALPCVVLGMVIFIIINKYIPANFLYHAISYDITYIYGILARALCFVCAIGFGGTILFCMSDKDIKITRLGKDTLPAYILHPFFLNLLAPLVIVFGNIISVSVCITIWSVAVSYMGSRFVRPVSRIN